MSTKTLIGIAGGTASGKSAIARHLQTHFNHNICATIKVDSYYHDLKHLTMKEREKTNFDNPESIDFDLLLEHIKRLNDNEPVKIPVYDYKTHTRTSDHTMMHAQKIIIIEGLYALYDVRIKSILNFKVFVDTKESIRLKRRIKRDIQKRQRTYESVIKQFNSMVAPMHNQYVEPTKSYADLIITTGVKNTIAINELISKITHVQNNSNKM